MRTVTKTYHVYHFEELDEDGKEAAKQEYLNDPCRCDDFSDTLKYDLENLFPNSKLKAQFSLCSCQGDGVNIYGDLDIRDVFGLIEKNLAGDRFSFLKNYLTEKEKKAVLFYFGQEGWTVELPVNREYAYCMADHLDFIWDLMDSLEMDGIAKVNKKALEKLHNMIVQVIKGLCRDYEKDGYEYYYEISDEDMQDLCEANEWEFYSDGSLYV